MSLASHFICWYANQYSYTGLVWWGYEHFKYAPEFMNGFLCDRMKYGASLFEFIYSSM